MTKLRVAFAYPVTAVRQRARKEQVFFRQDAVEFEIPDLSASECEVAVDADIDYRDVRSFTTRVIGFGGECYRSTLLRSGREVVADIEAGFSLQEAMSFLDIRSPWAFDDEIVDDLPLTIDRIVHDGRDDVVAQLAGVFGAMVRVDGALHKRAAVPAIAVSPSRGGKHDCSLTVEERPLVMHWNFPLDCMVEARHFLQECYLAKVHDPFANAYASAVRLRIWRPELLPPTPLKAMMCDVAASTFLREAGEFVARMRPEGLEALANLSRLRNEARERHSDISSALCAEIDAFGAQDYFFKPSHDERRQMDRQVRMANVGLSMMPSDPAPPTVEDDGLGQITPGL
ncbi:hypothetical protein [Bosea sp. RAC05]|uniref:hypothetical protein n=1 Tax=Bosea sp. RAC05 TaxID=1842539 RepID=UPI00083E6B93|nr:hypothetical protein [Bosea sp. RAC05]AOG03093.1 hypothetical protein BSY19_4831 [Bosea sp. RAC05]